MTTEQVLSIISDWAAEQGAKVGALSNVCLRMKDGSVQNYPFITGDKNSYDLKWSFPGPKYMPCGDKSIYKNEETIDQISTQTK